MIPERQPVDRMATATDRYGIDLRGSDPDRLEIGLVNNMPDTALRATERQFVALLGAAAQGVAVRLRLFSLPDVPRTDWARDHVNRFYSSIDDLWNCRVDGLIVTGTEPRASDLRHEPYWGSLTQVLDWAERNTASTIWSCLAAHAAVLHLDGIVRRQLETKRFGVFACARVSDHPLVSTAPSRVHMPHSRWNDLPEAALREHGYRILTRSDAAGVDTFVKQLRSLFVFFQGHPEYDADALLLEYRRDIGRFLKGERETYPSMPQGYFDEDTLEGLLGLQERALADRNEKLMDHFHVDQLTARVQNTWHSASVGVYRSWLAFIGARKDRRVRNQTSLSATLVPADVK